MSGVALVTGASRGIGRAVALRLARDGYDMALCSRQPGSAVEAVMSEIMALGRRVFYQPCDVGDMASVQNFVSAAEEALGPITVVVNSAGIIKDNPLVLMEPEAWHDVITTNLDGVFHVCRCAIFGFMKRKEGCIVNISSVSGVYGNPTQSNYSASKAGIIGFSKAVAKEVGRYGIRVNVVAPGFIATDMTAGLEGKGLSRLIENIPLRRIGDVQDVAGLVSFLVSKEASYITGQVIQVDGGIVL